MTNTRGISTTIFGAISGVAFTVGCVLAAGGFHRANAVTAPSAPQDEANPEAAVPPPWPAEIQNVWSALPSGADALTVKSDQQCSTVEAGLLAHCVRLQCKRLDEQTACVEVLMTARRLPAASASEVDDTDRTPGAALRATPVAPDASLHRTSQSS